MAPSNPVRALFYTLGQGGLGGVLQTLAGGGKEEHLPLRPEYLSLGHVLLPPLMLLSKVPTAVYTRSQLRYSQEHATQRPGESRARRGLGQCCLRLDRPLVSAEHTPVLSPLPTLLVPGLNLGLWSLPLAWMPQFPSSRRHPVFQQARLLETLSRRGGK